MKDEIDCEFTDEIVCPYCGFVMFVLNGSL